VLKIVPVLPIILIVVMGMVSLSSPIDKAVVFLRATQFDQEIGLCREKPMSSTYWLLSDNYVAYHALKDLDMRTANVILSKLDHYGYFSNGKHEAIVGFVTPVPPYATRVIEVDRIGDKRIIVEVVDREHRFLDWDQYADLVCYVGFSAVNRSDVELIDACIERLNVMWDGDGFSDKAFNGRQHETYKLALALLLCKRSMRKPDWYDKALEILLKMQRGDGGVVTHYEHGTLRRVGNANTETTSMFIIALKE